MTESRIVSPEEAWDKWRWFSDTRRAPLSLTASADLAYTAAILGEQRARLIERMREAEGEPVEWVELVAIFGHPDGHTISAVKDQRPHSRACGFLNHDHGSDCWSDCPTCGGNK